MPRQILLVCGIAASLLYVAMNIFIPMQFAGYSIADQTVSELSAIGAPTRSLWVPLGLLYSLLTMGFGWGVWRSNSHNRYLRIAGMLLLLDGIFSLYWPPMHLRGAVFSLTDTLHIVWSAVTVLLMMLSIGFAAAGLGMRFRLYSIITLVVLLLFGGLTGMDAPKIAQNLPTPMIGVWERISIAAFMLWVAVLAIVLLRNKAETIPMQP
jgi:hypothetical protein